MSQWSQKRDEACKRSRAGFSDVPVTLMPHPCAVMEERLHPFFSRELLGPDHPGSGLSSALSISVTLATCHLWASLSFCVNCPETLCKGSVVYGYKPLHTAPTLLTQGRRETHHSCMPPCTTRATHVSSGAQDLAQTLNMVLCPSPPPCRGANRGTCPRLKRW